MTKKPTGAKTFAEKFRELKEKVRKPDGKPYTLKEIEKDTGISLSYLRALLRGDRQNPTTKVEQALTEFFGVDDTYFREEPAEKASKLAEKINYLLATVVSPDGDPYTPEEVERGTAGKVSKKYFENLRKGIAVNPRQDQIIALARFFKVSPGFFYEEETPAPVKIDERVLKVLQDAKAMKIAFRVAEELNEESKDYLLDLIDHTIRFTEISRKARREKEK